MKTMGISHECQRKTNFELELATKTEFAKSQTSIVLKRA